MKDSYLKPERIPVTLHKTNFANLMVSTNANGQMDVYGVENLVTSILALYFSGDVVSGQRKDCHS